MLIKCPECDKDISDKAISCPNCGFPINTPTTAKRTSYNNSRTVKYRRLPNGFGSIRVLTGRRRNKYAAYPPVKDYKDNGTPIRDKAIGYFEDYNSAYQALMEYNKDPYDTNAKDITFAEVYEMFFDEKFNRGKRKYSDQSIYSAKSGFKNLAKIHKMKMADIKARDVQQIIDDSELKHASLELIVMVFKQVSQFALENDIIEKDYSQYVKINIPDDDEKGVPFNERELKILWDNRDDKTVQVVLMLTCTGMRISELQKVKYVSDIQCYVGGNKTRAGKGRTIPVSNIALQFLDKIDIKSIQVFRREWTETFDRLGIGISDEGTVRTPHDCRHTFSWAWDKFVKPKDDLAKHLVMGHSLGNDVEDNVYGHRTPQELLEKVNMMYKDLFTD